jgi:hypothetical protein
VLVAGLGCLLVAGSGTAADAKTSVYKPVLPEDMFTRLVTEDAKTISDSLAKAKGAEAKKMTIKAKAAALMIAVYAQDEMLRPGANAQAMAGLRDEAVKVIKALSGGKTAQAQQLAGELKPTGKAEPGAKTTPLPLQDNTEIDIVMQQFKPELGGGLALEKKLLSYVNKRSAYTPAEYQQMVPLLYRIAAIAQPTEALVPAPMGKKTPAQWTKFSEEMGHLALQAAQVAKKAKPDDKEVKAALKKLEANCTACHNVFRDE